MLTTVEKVLFLQEIDIFEYTSTEDLSHIAAITEESELQKDEIIFQEGDLPDAMYMVINGQVRMTRAGEEVMVAGAKDVFGTWALFDDDPRVLTATATEDTKLLRIDRNEFNDLLSDDVRIAKGIIRTVTRKLRELAGRVS